MLRYYLAVILGGPSVVAAASYFASRERAGFSLLYAFIAAYLATAVAFGIDALAAILTRALAKGRAVDPLAPYYTVAKWEKKLYVKLGVRVWKDKIPEMGGLLVGFQKKKVETRDDPEYLMFFLRETCYAELMHIISAFLGFLNVFTLPLSCALYFAVPVAIVNFVLNILPVIVQRYVRPSLLLSYNRCVRKAQKREEKEEISVK